MITRSKKMVELADIHASLEQIKNDLLNKATNEKIDELLKKIDEKDKKIQDLESRLEILESKNATNDNTIKLLERKVDDNESYHRRQNLRIVGIPQPVNGAKESEDECLQKVKNDIDKLGVELPNLDWCLDRAHRVGPIKVDEGGNVMNRPMIVRFTSWRARTAVYRNRVKRGNTRFYIDLTKRRFQLKKMASDSVRNNDKVEFVFADVNNNLCVRLKNGHIKFFNSEDEFHNILNNL